MSLHTIGDTSLSNFLLHEIQFNAKASNVMRRKQKHYDAGGECDKSSFCPTNTAARAPQSKLLGQTISLEISFSKTILLSDYVE